MADNKENIGKHNVNIVQLSNYVKPVIKETKSKDWVLNGDKNNFFKYVIDRYNGSPTNGAIISGFSNLIYGKGLSARDGHKKPLDYARMITLFKPDEVRKMVLDFKLQGQFAMQIIYNRDRTINSVTHFPIETLAPEKMNEEGIIEAYYYSADWNKPRGDNEPVRISSFGTSKDGREMFVCKPYEAGQLYFSLPDYVQGLQYAEVEEEISNFYINHIHNGFSFGYILNMNNGETLNDDQKYELQQSIRKEMTGSTNAGKVVVSFNNGKEQEVTIVPLEVNDAHNQWENLNRESEEKIMRAHKVVSPMIFGIKNNTGLGNNADELSTAMDLLMDMTINPMQNEIIDCFNKVLAVEGVSLDLFFESFVEEEVANVETSFTGIQISSALDIIAKVNIGELTESQGKSLLKSMLAYPENEINNIFEEKTRLKSVCLSNDVGVADLLIELGEDAVSDEWELIDDRAAEEITLTESRLNAILELAKAPTANNSRQSKQDTSIFKIRYQYAGNKNPEREFCRKVINANKFYRVEDLENASNQSVNKGFGPNGADTYNIFFYKGGVNCKHFWQRKIFLKKNSKQISVNQARKLILELEPSEREAAKWEQNPKEVAQIAEEKNNFWKLN
jgi:hypothetical protein